MTDDERSPMILERNTPCEWRSPPDQYPPERLAEFCPSADHCPAGGECLHSQFSGEDRSRLARELEGMEEIQMTDDERERLIAGLRQVEYHAPWAWTGLRQVQAQLRLDGERIKALEKLAEAADLMRVIIENSAGVWRCGFAINAEGEWHGEHCPWADFECVANFLAELQSARERQGGR